MEKCPSCGNNTVKKVRTIVKFLYGNPPVVLTTSAMPTYYCKSCKERFRDHVGEDEYEATVERYKQAFRRPDNGETRSVARISSKA
jgi:YgiT-type zinc finger domain-containing protein